MNIFKSIGLYLLLNFFVVLFALLISSLHFSELYFKYIYTFSGISLATTVPLFLIILTVFFVKDNKFHFSSVLSFLKRPILIYQVIVCGIVLFGLLFYISRSGNSGVLLPFEKELRTLMTDLFSVRPRTKEFLLAQPILIASIYFFNKNYFSRFLLPVAAIAQISIINTFCHLHTPIIVNILRASFGTLIGLVLGLILICIILLLIWLFKKLKKHKS